VDTVLQWTQCYSGHNVTTPNSLTLDIQFCYYKKQNFSVKELKTD